MRSLVLLGLIAIATSAIATSASSAGSLRQLFFGEATGHAHTDLSQTQAAAANPMLTAVEPQSGSTMAVERRGHSATSLSDGRVLVVGGDNSGGLISQSEIFDPTTATFSVGANLGGARTDHSATRLADGRVLIAGGRGASGALNTTEIFDPTTGAFASGPAMSVARAGHSATLFADGRVLIAGGDANGSAEMFDVSSGGSAVGSLSGARSMHSAALLQDGRVLVVGGRDADGNELSSGEIFDTAAGTFSAVDGTLKVGRVRAHLRVLFDGKVQIIGGSNDGSMEIYDPMIEAFGAYAHVLPESDPCVGLSSQVMASQTRAALFHNGQADPLLDRVSHTITELNGQALVVGGANSSGAVLGSFSVLASSSASITTDKLDYAPGETVSISGRGFQPGETVRVKIHEDPHTDLERGFDAVADAEGNFSGEYLVQDYDLSMRFIMGARGLTSGATAQTTFTDARNWELMFAGTGSGSVTVTPNTGTVNAPVSCGGTGTNTASQTVTSTCLPNITTSANGATVTFTASANVGSTFNGWSGQADLSSSSCTGTTNPCSAVIGPNGKLTVTFGGGTVATTTAVTSSQNPSTYGQPVTFTATVTPASGATAPTGSVQFQIGGVNFGLPVALSPSGSNGVANSGSISTLNVADSPHEITAVYTPTGSFTGSTSPIFNQDVNKADQTIIFAALPDKTYGDAPFVVSATGGASGNPVTFSASGDCTSSGLNGSTITITGAGFCTVTASQAGDDNYNAAANVDQSFDINKAVADCSSIVGYTGTYDAAAHGASGACTGVAGDPTAAGSSLDLGASFTDVPGGTANWTFTGGTNYTDQNGSVAIVINKATPTVSVTGGTFVFDFSPHPATGFAYGVGGVGDVLSPAVTFEYVGTGFTTYGPTATAPTFVGTYQVTATFVGNQNYYGAANTANITITTACSTFNGFLPPIDGVVEQGTGGSFANPVRSFKLNSTIPVKFNAICFGSALTTGIHTLQAIKYSNAIDSDPPIDATPTDAATTGNQFRLTGTEWHFNLSTKGLGNNGQGTWLLKATLFDGSTYSVWVAIKK